MDYLSNFKVVLIIMAYAFTLTEQDEPTEYGKRFVFTFLENLCEETLKLTITAFTDAEIVIHVPTRVDSLFIPGGNSKTISFPVTLLPNRSTIIGQRAVRVTSTTEVALYAFNLCSYSSASFNVLPVSQLGTEYYITSTGFILNTDLPSFSIIAVKSNTTISINFRIRSSGGCGPTGEFTDGQVHSFDLNEFEDFTIYCSGDPTGTAISSTLPVAVVAGHVGTKIPASISGRDAIAEMLPPVSMYGKRHILHGPGPDRGAVFRILTSKVDTDLMTSEGTTYNLDPGDFIELDLGPGEALCLRSSEAIMVVMYGKGAKLCPGDQGDPFMVILTPVERFGTTFTSNLTSLVSGSLASSTSLVMRSSFVSDLDTGFNVQDIPSCLYSVATRDIANGNLDYPMPNNASFFMIVYMHAPFEANAFVLTSSAIKHRHWRDCDRNPCLNGGKCSADLFNYTCECPLDFSGFRCEETVSTSSFSIYIDPSTVPLVSPDHPETSSLEITVHSSETMTFPTRTDTLRNLDSQSTHIYELSERVTTESLLSGTFVHMSFYSTSESTIEKISLFPDRDVTPSETNGDYESTPFYSTTNVVYDSTSSISESMFDMGSTYWNFQDGVTSSDTDATPSLAIVTDLEPEVTPLITEMASSGTEVASSKMEVTLTTLSTSSYTTVTPQTTVLSKYICWSCPCKCPEIYATEDIPQVINQLQEDIRDNLIVDAKALSKQIRKKTSAPDDRPSAKQMGGGAIALLIVVFVIFIVTDFIKIVQDILYGCTSQKRWRTDRSDGLKQRVCQR